MLQFMKTYFLDIIFLMVFLLFIGWLYYKKKYNWIRKIVLTLVVEAEKKLGSGTGELKYDLVVTRVYELLPKLLRIFLTKKQLDIMIEDAVQYLKTYLDDGKNLIGYEEEFRTGD